ncbi:thiol reductant ABC exporter subunit CydD [Paenibacillus daejeonensis]|uniref:thiol reductant ABC exporter subunit CydD n=1 Tax=Paenibacillus daejeonensis TaxID=135193 RepID=UPI00036E15DD|nr:thiol reductant ABC exporter subunit CydD [Paenibacillus daejeonensis]
MSRRSRGSSLLTQAIAPYRTARLLLGVFSLIAGAAIIAQAAFISTIVNRVFVQEATVQAVTAMLAALLAVIILRSLSFYGNGRIGQFLSARAKSTIRGKAIRHLAHATVPASLSGQTGGKVSLVMDAVDEADSYYSQYIPRMAETAFIPLMLLIVVFTQHWHSGLIMLLTAPFIPIFMILVGLRTKTKSEEKFAQLAEFSGTFLDALQGLVTLKIFGKVKRQEQDIERSSLGFRDATMGILRVAFTNTFMLELIVMLSIGVIALDLAFQMLIYKTLSFGTAFFILLLVPEFYSAIKNLGTAFHSGRTSMGAVKKVEELLQDSVSADDQAELGVSEAGLAEKSHSLDAGPPSIALADVSFRYGAEGFSLHAGGVTIGSGEHVAIVGSSGSGKTTLLHLITGLLRPGSGELLINGVPLQEYSEAEWFGQMSYITQHPYIFSGTIAENIAIGARRESSREAIKQAAEEAGLAPLIEEMEHGLDTPVGEGGRGLSGGEKQRLALARAFLNRPALLLFDEPTVGLDLHTERVLQRSITELSQGATMITVAHRLHTIRGADRILFMEQGQLIDSGTHEELAKRLPQYAEMVNLHQGGGFR